MSKRIGWLAIGGIFSFFAAARAQTLALSTATTAFDGQVLRSIGRSLLAGLYSFFLCIFLIDGAHAELMSLTEGFDTVGSAGPPATGIFSAGWLTVNNSNPLGNHNWGQGIPGNQADGLGANAQSGAANSFIQTDFQAGQAGSGGIVSDWLITPVLLLENGATISFYTQASPSNPQFPNELQVWKSQSGSSTVNVGSTAPNPGGDFTVELLDINPGATNASGTPGGYPTAWTQYNLTISGLSAPTDGRIGFRYYLPNVNNDGTIVGIDTFSFMDPTLTVPAPSIGHGVPVLLGVGGILFAAKLLERSKGRRLQFG